MKAAYIEECGSPDAIVFGNLPKPKPAERQALVKIEAVAVNPIDTYIRSGAVAMELPQPYIVGCDLAGVVEAVGPDVSRFQPGDRVWGSNQGLFGRQGTFADYAAVDERWLYPIPENVAAQDAAAVALVGITAHLALFREAKLKTGDAVFIVGGSGGVGSAAIQMAHAVGARVMTIAGSKEKVALCRRLGANTALNYKTEDISAALESFGPIDVWLDTRREPELDKAIARMALGGRIVVIAGRDAKPKIPLGSFYTKDCKLLGFAMFNAPAEEQRKSAAEINRWLNKGKLRPQIDRVMKLADAAEAHRLQEQSTLGKSGTLAGKIVLVP